MKFPAISDIATTSVVSVDINCTVSKALDLMLEQNHRDVIVIDGECFRVLTVMDVLTLRKNDTNLEIPLSELNLNKVPIINKRKNVIDTLAFLNDSVEYICVLNDDKTLYGLVTHTDITSNIDPDTLMDNYRLSEYLKQSRRMKWVSKDVTTSVLLQEMLIGLFDNVVVVEDMKPIGILTTKDIMQLIKYKNDLELEVGEYMSSPIDTVNKNSSIKIALAFIKRKHYKRVVVVDDNGLLAGIITQKELISLTYSKWAMLVKEYQNELSDINQILKNKNKEYEVLASTDSLTGLYNRYKFSELYISSYTSMVQRHNNMSFILLDIDWFKRVNDTYGHNVGDKVLIKISQALLKTLRDVDIVCRWGGEEFVILLPTVSLEKALLIAQKLRKYIENMKIDIVGGVTISFGVSEVREGEDMKDVVERADKALYLAKDSGRNCVKSELDI